jgi:uncharacterized protein
MPFGGKYAYRGARRRTSRLPVNIPALSLQTLSAVPVLGLVAMFAALVGAVTGGGVTAILLPVLVLYFGIQEAVPIATICLFVASVSRVAVYRRNLELAVIGWFCLGSLPAVVLGTLFFTRSAPTLLTRLFGVVLIGAVVWRRLDPHPPDNFARLWFAPLGAAYGLLSGVSAAMASVPAPFFLAYGLRKEAFVGTMGVSVFLGQLAKLGVFGQAHFLTTPVVVNGLVLSPFVICGTVLGKKVLTRVSDSAFVTLVDIFMVASGVLFIVRG